MCSFPEKKHLKAYKYQIFNIMERKKIIIYGSALAAVILGIFLITNVSKKKNLNADNPEFAPYISAYTSGVISKTSTIKIKVTSSVMESLDSTAIEDDILSISPNIEGKLKLTGNTLEFTPTENLPSDEEFYASLNLEKITKVPDKLADFNFAFRTIAQTFDYQIEEIKTTDKKTLKYQQISGVVNTADSETKESIAKVFTAKQKGKPLTIKWASETGGLSHYFTIDSIERFDADSEVKFAWDGDKIDADNDGDTVIAIPAISEFSYLSAQVIHQPDQFLQLQFSDPLDPEQDIKGLIQISGVKNFTTMIEDNLIKVYTPERLDSERNVVIQKGIKNILGHPIKGKNEFTVTFEALKPEIRFAGNGNILPSSDKGLLLPFEAVNVKAVDISVIKIYENSIMQFLQINDMDGDSELRRVGIPVLRKTVHLDEFKIADWGNWNKFTLDLNKLISPEPGAIYHIEMNFRQGHSVYQCEQSSETEEDIEATEDWTTGQAEASNWDFWDNLENSDYDYSYYDYWEDRDNPCKKAYYGDQRKISRNIFSSDLGIISKKGADGIAQLFVTDIKSAQPKAGVTVELFDYQLKKIGTAQTDKDGKAIVPKAEKAFFAHAKIDKQNGYLKIDDGNSMSLSRFNVSGTTVKQGLKGYIYGERGVWRPGDSLFLTFVLKETETPLPENHPIVFEFTNPRGQLIKKEVQTKNSTNVYSFIAETNDDAVTGNYNAKVTIGASTFDKTLKIETIKPNRLKINVDFGKKMLTEGKADKATMSVKWLHGAIAKDLKVEVDASLEPIKTEFGAYSDYSFDDPTKSFYADSERLLDEKTNENGEVVLVANLSTNKRSPGMLKAKFATRVYEKGGNFSIDQYSVNYSPYESYVGVKLPKGDKMRGMLLTDKKHPVEIAILSPEGKPVTDGHEINLKFYKLSWRWWWDEDVNEESSYNLKNSAQLLSSATVTTSGGKANWEIEVKYPDWGRYMVWAEDTKTGHSSGRIVFIDWPGWAGRAQNDSEGAAMLTFATDKEKYNVDDEVKITFPSSKGGRALVSIENGTKILKTYWVETEKNQTDFSFTVTKDMTPNVYAHITLLQKHAQTANDLPIRMYGVKNISVEDADTHLQPVIEMPNELEAERDFTIKVSEKDGRGMTYTVAIVDEGLLDLTRFKTPNPWESFYAKEALGVKTWDLYNDVIGAFTGDLSRLIAIGGDANVDEPGSRKANRFKSVVKFLGPFTLTKGTNSHTIRLPKYIGSVRTMVVASEGNAYGSAEKSTPVIKPVMIIGTLPRVLGPKEKVKMPVSVFAMKPDIKNIELELKTNGLIKIIGSKTKNLTFAKPGEQDAEFELEVGAITGIGTVQVIAKSGSETSTFEIEIDVRNPNHRITDAIGNVLNAGESWDNPISPIGIAGTNTAVLEVSSIPPINLESRLEYLISYPHGCIEQTTSAVFPQLYVNQLINLPATDKDKISKNINAGIKSLNSFQMTNGGFTYWPGSNDVSIWGTNYAGHFLIEAEKAGYPVSPSLMKKWKSYQAGKAKNWTDDGPNSQLEQAYRLYTLALAGEAETGAMNRLKNTSALSASAQWRLAAAYVLAGKKKIAEEMVVGLTTKITPYNETGGTYGSDVRDRAMILETLTLLDKKAEAFALLQELSKELSDNKYMSTQSTAYALIAVSGYVSKHAKAETLQFSYVINGKSIPVSEKALIVQKEISIKDAEKITFSIKNSGKGMLYTRLILSGIPDVGVAAEGSNNLNMTVKYLYPDGTEINPNKLAQGTDFIAEVTLTNPGTRGDYNEIALSQIFPSGWEIINTRVLDIDYGNTVSSPEYVDFRDDRVFTYFDLPRGKAKTFAVLLNASYAGTYWMPPTHCEAMYDATINARKGGGFVSVTQE